MEIKRFTFVKHLPITNSRRRLQSQLATTVSAIRTGAASPPRQPSLGARSGLAPRPLRLSPSPYQSPYLYSLTSGLKIEMDNVLIDRSASGIDFRGWTDGDGCRSRSFGMSLPTPRSSHSPFGYALPLPPFQYAPYLHSSLSLPPLPPRRPPLLPRSPAAANKAKYATGPPAPATKTASVRTTVAGEYKRKKPRAPRAVDEPPRVQRRKPLERAAPLPPAPAVDEALDDLEREVVRGFVEDLMHVLAPPPSSLPLPTFSLVRAAAAKAAAAPCAV